MTLIPNLARLWNSRPIFLRFHAHSARLDAMYCTDNVIIYDQIIYKVKLLPTPACT